MEKPESTKLSTSEVARRHGTHIRTVRLWCRQGLFPNAKLVSTPRGDIWYIPESDLETFKRPAMGRPKTSAAKKDKAQ